MPGQDNSVCPRRQQGQNGCGDSNDAADDSRAWPADGRDSVSVRAVRHGRRPDPDRRAAGVMPLPSAMVLHAITQMASNGWRAFLWRRHIRWRPVAIYLIGCALALGAWSITRYVPDKPVALLLLGVTPFMARLTPAGLKPNPDSIWQGTFYGSICMGLMLMTGVSGPLMDTFFLGGKFDRREHRRHQGRLPGRQPLRQADLFRRHHRSSQLARSGAGGRRGRGVDDRHHAGAAHPGGHDR